MFLRGLTLFYLHAVVLLGIRDHRGKVREALKNSDSRGNVSVSLLVIEITSHISNKCAERKAVLVKILSMVNFLNSPLQRPSGEVPIIHCQLLYLCVSVTVF